MLAAVCIRREQSASDARVDGFVGSLMARTRPEAMSSFTWSFTASGPQAGGVIPGGVLTMLPSLQQLTRLVIQLPCDGEGAPQQGFRELLPALSALTNLQSLTLRGGQTHADFPPPHVLRLPALTRLEVEVHTASGTSSGLAQHTQLRELEVHSWPGLRFPAAALELQQLRDLRLNW